jgi:signal transduction histidine kinase
MLGTNGANSGRSRPWPATAHPARSTSPRRPTNPSDLTMEPSPKLDANGSMEREAPWRVLVIDDEEDIRDVLTMTLSDAGCSVRCAADGLAGLALCKDFDPQIVITDIRMPRLDGLQVLERIKREHPAMEVIVATAYGDMAQAIRALQLDASDFITKPVGAEALMVALDRARQRHRMRQELALRQRRQLEDQARLLHQDKMMSLGRLAASVAHEINNPLSGILNYLRLMIRILERGTPGQAELARFGQHLALVESEAARCARIVSNLLTFARKHPVRDEAVRVEALIERCMVLSRHRLELENISWETRIPLDLPPVRGDANQLQQCLLNLIFNAVDAMDEGGRLTLAASREGGGAVAIAVQDTGCGIPARDLPHLFEPFFTTKPDGQGTGLGLSTTYGIVERHGGSIAVQSRERQGTTFTIRLPALGAAGKGGGHEPP